MGDASARPSVRRGSGRVQGTLPSWRSGEGQGQMGFIRLWASGSYFRQRLMLGRERERCHGDVCPCQAQVREQSVCQQPLTPLVASPASPPHPFPRRGKQSPELLPHCSKLGRRATGWGSHGSDAGVEPRCSVPPQAPTAPRAPLLPGAGAVPRAHVAPAIKADGAGDAGRAKAECVFSL